MTRVRWLLAAIVALGSIALSAHEVAVEQFVDMAVRLQDDRLVVRVHAPAAVLAEAKLPVLADGTLDTARLERPLQIAAAETARNLDLQQDDAPLAAAGITARPGDDRRSVDIELTYRVIPAAGGVSARLNVFPSAPLRPVRTTVRY